MRHFYRVFGLAVESAIECPELLRAEATHTPDVLIGYAEVPEVSRDAGAGGLHWQAAPGRFIADVESLGRFLVRDGRQIDVQPREGAPEDSLRQFLLGICLSILLEERRLFVLHCSGVATELGTVLFAGKSGAGKSTMVSAFLERGYQIVADDMLALAVNEQGEIMALPGLPQVKLWADAAQALGRTTGGLRRVTPELDKFVAPERDRFSSHPARLHAIYDLRITSGSSTTLEPLPHSARFNILLDHTWAKATLAGLGLREWHFHTAARIASLAYAARLTRPVAPLDVKRAADLVEADMKREYHPT
jgi:hypothetical protein